MLQTEQKTAYRIQNFTSFIISCVWFKEYGMKRVLAVALLMCIVLSGCGFGGSTIFDILDFEIDGKVLSLTVEDSVSRLDIYPEESKVIGKFDRMQFKNLSPLQQSIYIQLDNAIYNMEPGFIDAGVCSYRDLELVYYALRQDRPEYFWLPSQYVLRVVGERRMIQFAETDADWSCTKQERAEIESDIKKQLGSFFETVKDEPDQFQLELEAHDWVIDKASYNYAAVEDKEKYPEAWTIEGVFSKSTAVCEGYARSMQILLYMLGIECSNVVGVTEEAHMWNIVKINDEWYHQDATADDGGESGIYYTYFNVTDEFILNGRTIYSDFESVSDEDVEKWSYNYKLPSCDSRQDNYFIKTGAFVSDKSQFSSALISLVCAAAREGKNEVQIAFSKETGFDYETMDDPNEFFCIAEILGEANEELESDQQISTYSWSYQEYGYNVKISW